MPNTLSGSRQSCDPAAEPEEHVVLDVEVIGTEMVVPGDPEHELDAPTPGEIQELCRLALASANIRDGHVAVEFVEEERIRELNRDHRRTDAPTDVLAFGIDEGGVPAGPRELGDIVICPEQTEDIREAIVHGALHLTGMDHETDDGEMLALQAELMRWLG